MNLINTAIFTALLTLSCATAIALPSDRVLPIDVYSEDYSQDVARGVMSYIGNARITQGNLVIQAARIDVTFVDRIVVKIVAEGSPASLVDIPELGRDLIEAEGNRVEYLVDEDQVTVVGDARFAHEGSEVTANQIIFDLSDAAAVATGGVRHVIQPPSTTDNNDDQNNEQENAEE